MTLGALDSDRPLAGLRVIDVALHEAVFSMMESLVPDYSAHEVLRARTGGRMQGIAPSNAGCARAGSTPWRYR